MKWLPLCSVLMLCACSWLGSDSDLEESSASPLTAEELYNDGLAALSLKEYGLSVEKFEEVDEQYPYSPWAVRAQVMAAYVAYLNTDYTTAISILERFVKLNPAHERTPYAYYLRALCYYDQISDVGRDQKKTREAEQALRDVVARYPNSDYARDAKLKLELTSDHLAGKEMTIGRYYLQRDEFVASINRFKYVLQKFETTAHAPEALHRLVEAYLRLGLKEEAQRYAAVLGYNYPGSDWYEFSYKMLNGNVDPETAADADWTDLFPGI